MYMHSLHGDGLQVILKTWNELHKGYTETKPYLIMYPRISRDVKTIVPPKQRRTTITRLSGEEKTPTGHHSLF